MQFWHQSRFAGRALLQRADASSTLTRRERFIDWSIWLLLQPRLRILWAATSVIVCCWLHTTGWARKRSETFGIENPGNVQMMNYVVAKTQSFQSIMIRETFRFRLVCKLLYLSRKVEVMISHPWQLRQSRAGRPKGSRDKRPRVRGKRDDKPTTKELCIDTTTRRSWQQNASVCEDTT